MARLTYADLDKLALTPENQKLMARKANLYTALANSPKGLAAFGALACYIRFDSKLDKRLNELAILMVAYTTRQPYQWSHHIEIATRRFGLKNEDIRALKEEASARDSTLDPLAKAVVRASKEMTETLGVSDATFAALRRGLDDADIVDLFITIGFYNGVARTLEALQVDVEDDYKPFLDEFPLPADYKA